MWRRAGQRVIERNRNKSVNNFLIDFYLDGFKKRRQKRENKVIVLFNYFTLISYSVCFLNLCFTYSLKLKFETKLLLFDVWMFMGGIEKYHKIVLIFCTILGIGVNIMLRLRVSKHVTDWTQLFEMIRSKVKPLFINRNSYDEVLRKLKKWARILYFSGSLLCFSMGKYNPLLMDFSKT